MLNIDRYCMVCCAWVVGVVLPATAWAAGHAEPATKPTIPPASQVDEAKLIALLGSDASLEAKFEACRHLQVYGTARCVPTLAKLLGDEKLAHMARTALEAIDDPSVDAALRQALDGLSGRLAAGVIGSLGVRKDATATKALARRLADPDPVVAGAAARALGSIGTAEAAALEAARTRAGDAVLPHVYEGLFRCAESLAEVGDRETAVGIYDRLRTARLHQVRGGAVRGAILARGRAAIGVLREALADDDYIVFTAAVQASQEMRGRRVTDVLCSTLPKLDADRRIVLIESIAMRQDATALPALTAQAQNGPTAVRIKAIAGLATVGDAQAVPVLVKLLDEADKAVAAAAQESLAALPLPEADQAVMAMLRDRSAAKQLKALELIGRRRMAGAMEGLYAAARSQDAAVRTAALRRIGELGGPAQLGDMLALLPGLTETTDQRAAEQALRNLCTPNGQRNEAAIGMLCDRVGPARGTAKHVLLRVVGALGGSKALETVRAAMKDRSPQVRQEATRVLLAWPNAEAASDMLALAETAKTTAERIAAVRAYIGAIRDPKLSVQDKLAMCDRARGLIQRTAEKRLLLGVLGGIGSPRALAMAAEYLDDAQTRNEAALAAVAIGEKLANRKNAQVAAVMQKVIDATDNNDVKKRARAVLQKTR